jgi:hypothetical protein
MIVLSRELAFNGVRFFQLLKGENKQLSIMLVRQRPRKRGSASEGLAEGA